MFKYIRAMSFDKQTISSNLVSKASPLTDHLIKLYLFSDCEYVNHWRQEVWGFLNKVPKMRHNNKFPSYKFIFDHVSGYCDMTEEIMYQMLDKYSMLTPVRLDVDELKSILNSYFEWLSKELASRGVVDPSEVYSKLEELGL